MDVDGAVTALHLPTGGYAHTTLYENSSLIYAIDFQELRDQIRNAWNSGTGGVDLRWLVTDQLGTPRMVFDQSGSLTTMTRHDYLPFGEELFAGTGGRTTGQGYPAPNTTGLDGARQKFTLKERDNETGLDYFLARYYSSMQGRFTTVDPIMIHDDRLEEPQRLNLYEYCRNNPLRFIDPNGLDDITYNQSGQEISRTDHHGRFWHLFHSDTWHLRANDGTSYNLDSRLRQLPNGQTYNIVDKDKSWQLVTQFVNSNRMRPGERPIGYNETKNRALSVSQWNWKIRLNRQFGPHTLFVFDSAAHPSDYIGNVGFGFVMASYQYTETMARFGAGMAQLWSGHP